MISELWPISTSTMCFMIMREGKAVGVAREEEVVVAVVEPIESGVHVQEEGHGSLGASAYSKVSLLG